MPAIPTNKALVAVDLGAQSCRVSLLRLHGAKPELRIVHRFPNSPVSTARGLRWDIQRIFTGVQAGLQLCAQQAPEGIASVAVDGWAVDYVRLLPNGSPADDPFCYRDPRTGRAAQAVHAIMSPAQLYSLTGIQILHLNTLYQLYADKLAGLDPATPWANLPEFISYRLGGKRVAEFTNATHTAMVALGTHNWCGEIFEKTVLDVAAAPEIVPTGTIVGMISGELARLPQFHHTQIIVPACHDTASAIAAIPAVGHDWAFISSGTWSLVGAVLDAPCVTEDARALNFTNLGAVGGKICFLKNVNGTWLLQQCMEEWEKTGHHFSFDELLSACESLPIPACCIDVDDPDLLLPGDMLSKINLQMERLGQPRFNAESSAIPSVANLIFHSLAARYATVLSAVEKVTGKKLKRVFIVGGGNQNTLLNRLTAKLTGLEIILGPTEASSIGNLAVQMAALVEPANASHGVSALCVAKWAEWISSSYSIHNAPQAKAANRDLHA
jgi:rhamnulokinase